ncbi:hypothetical protein LCGC14_2616300 [marine sediment metagenome]|uniref:Uncharacterized protein n=1 Tax=marine sediment metagenome TaxID=412755 RepID=A0A0F9CX23_9ZZZZ
MTEQMMKPSKIPCALWLCVAMLTVVLSGGAAAEERLFQINNCPEESVRYCKIYTYAEKQDGEWRAVRTGLVASECEFFRDTNPFPDEKKCYQGDELLLELRAREVMVAPQVVVPWDYAPGWTGAATGDVWSPTMNASVSW